MHSCLLQIPATAKRVLVAFSGGLDSSVLLYLCCHANAGYDVVAWHINHGLIDAADQMENFCRQRAAQLGVEIRIDHLNLTGLDANVEAEARRLRYDLFRQHTGVGDCLLTAHHADDQAETFLLNALRASGSAGLRGIAARRQLGDCLLLRPLLSFSREELAQYAQDNEIPWFDDPSNQSDRFDRNYLRNRVMPAIAQRWPRYQAALSTSAQIQAQTQELLDQLAAADMQALQAAESDGIQTLDADALLALSSARRYNLLRYWIADAGFAPLPNARLRELIQQLNARADALPKISMPGYSVRLYDRRLFLVRETAEPDCEAEYRFDRAPQIDIDALDLHLSREDVFRQLELEDRNQALVIRFRQRGQQNPDRHRLKRFYQKHRVPPWRRASVAQVYLDDRLEGLLL